MNITKKHLAVLERLFAAEVEGAITGGPALREIKSKAARECAEMGLIKRSTETLPGRFPVRIEGWELTIEGNFAYCMSLSERDAIMIHNWLKTALREIVKSVEVEVEK